MSDYKLRGLVYQPLEQPFGGLYSTIAVRLNLLGKTLATQMATIRTLVPSEVKPADWVHSFCSTSVSMPFSVGDLDLFRMYSQVPNRIKWLVPSTVVNAYECASWGFALRSMQQLYPMARYQVVTILDVNFYDMEIWVDHPAYGKSGFGVMTVILEREPEEFPLVRAGGGYSEVPLNDYCMDLYRYAAKRPDAVLALPFLQEKIRKVLDGVFSSRKKLENLYAEFGHNFGSDPWLAYACQATRGTLPDHCSQVIFSSFALSGYYCFTEIATPNRVPVVFLDEVRS